MKVAFLTSGGIAPCLSASIGLLIKKYSELDSSIEMMGYLNGYKGLLMNKSITITKEIIASADNLCEFGGSPIGNSRVKLSNVEDCIKNGYIKSNQDPMEVAAHQLVSDGVDILHTIGGDDTNTTAGELVVYLKKNGYNLTVVGLPKTVDNDVYPIFQTLGAWTAAEQSAIFFDNIANENTTSSRQLIIHEVMGRNCGWLTAASAFQYRSRLKNKNFLPSFLVSKSRWDIDAIYIPELKIDFNTELKRLRERMDDKDCVNIFLSEGAGIETIIEEMENNGVEIPRDAFGHVRLDEINPGKWFAQQFSEKLNCDKVLVQKSGYFARSASPNKNDLDLISESVDMAVSSALEQNSGVVGLNENQNNKMQCIDFEKIKGGKPFNVKLDWFQKTLTAIKQK